MTSDFLQQGIADLFHRVVDRPVVDPPGLMQHMGLVSLALAVAALAALPARMLLRRDPTACYRLLLALLLGALALFPVQLVVQGRAQDQLGRVREWARGWFEPDVRTPSTAPGDAPALEAPAPGVAASEESFLVRQMATERSDPDAPLASAAPVAEGLRAGAGPAPWLAALRSWAARIDLRSWIAGTWIVGAFALGVRRLLRWLRTRRLLARARPVEDPELLRLWRRVARDSPLAPRVGLVLSQDVESPACAGTWRPVLIVPADPRRRADAGALEWALRHELVHLERGDTWVAALQSLVTMLLWFNPAAWWLSAEITRLRELSCDQLVVQTSGRRRSYALALLEYASHCTHVLAASDAEPHSAGARCALLHWSRSPSQIRRRIEMLTDNPVPPSRGRLALGRLLALSALVVPAGAQLSVAATLFAKEAPAATEAAAACTTGAECHALADCDDGCGHCKQHCPNLPKVTVRGTVTDAQGRAVPGVVVQQLRGAAASDADAAGHAHALAGLTGHVHALAQEGLKHAHQALAGAMDDGKKQYEQGKVQLQKEHALASQELERALATSHKKLQKLHADAGDDDRTQVELELMSEQQEEELDRMSEQIEAACEKAARELEAQAEALEVDCEGLAEALDAQCEQLAAECEAQAAECEAACAAAGAACEEIPSIDFSRMTALSELPMIVQLPEIDEIVQKSLAAANGATEELQTVLAARLQDGGQHDEQIRKAVQDAIARIKPVKIDSEKLRRQIEEAVQQATAAARRVDGERDGNLSRSRKKELAPTPELPAVPALPPPGVPGQRSKVKRGAALPPHASAKEPAEPADAADLPEEDGRPRAARAPRAPAMPREAVSPRAGRAVDVDAMEQRMHALEAEIERLQAELESMRAHAQQQPQPKPRSSRGAR